MITIEAWNTPPNPNEPTGRVVKTYKQWGIRATLFAFKATFLYDRHMITESGVTNV